MAFGAASLPAIPFFLSPSLLLIFFSSCFFLSAAVAGAALLRVRGSAVQPPLAIPFFAPKKPDSSSLSNVSSWAKEPVVKQLGSGVFWSSQEPFVAILQSALLSLPRRANPTKAGGWSQSGH